MGNREECPVCKGFGSDIYQDFENQDPCRRCGTSYEAILSFYEIENKKNLYKSNKITIELITENESLKKELVLKRDRYKKFQEVVYGMYWRMQELVKELDREWMDSIKSWDKDE